MTSFLIMTGTENGAAYAECDQLVSTLIIAKREVADLSKMGVGQIRVYEFASEGLAQDYIDEKDNAFPSKRVAKLVMTKAPRD